MFWSNRVHPIQSRRNLCYDWSERERKAVHCSKGAFGLFGKYLKGADSSEESLKL